MKNYECLYIVNSDSDTEGISRITDKVQGYLKNNGAEIANIQHWGKRKLAYVIEKQRYGNFVLTHFTGEAPNLAAFQREMEIDSQILAYMCIRLDSFPDFDSLAIPQTYDTERKRTGGPRRGGRRFEGDDDYAARDAAREAPAPAKEADVSEDSEAPAPSEEIPVAEAAAEDTVVEETTVEDAVEAEVAEPVAAEAVEAPAEEAVVTEEDETVEAVVEETPAEDVEEAATDEGEETPAAAEEAAATETDAVEEEKDGE